MGNYIALYVHLIWTTKYREPVLHRDMRYSLLDHIRVKAMENDINICIVNGIDDHLHCLIALKATQAVSTVVKAIKGESSRWINEEKLLDDLFTWQDGYGAISVSPQDVPRVTHYIFNQEQHHAARTLDEELQKFTLYAQE
ncbi:IS200/IS605 family transposase [Spirosoma spitsbergense]|uniref:IS200/IS605 family transposase n=1 Tax=Spirosoma spitsbergense TaxID=431554 RepID=UPI00037BF130|nr:IS200/IS605 family transposase [Spirosoma spitsbergense]